MRNVGHRLTQRVHIIEANGFSYRLRESKRRLQRTLSHPEKSKQTEPTQSEWGVSRNTLTPYLI